MHQPYLDSGAPRTKLASATGPQAITPNRRLSRMTSDCPAEPASYKVFFLDEAGKIKKSKALRCADDEAAIAEAHRLADGRTLELYDGCRLVVRLPSA
jgi:hypothetical protein